MPHVGTPEAPLRVAIIGAGPAGFYAAEALFQQKDVAVSVDMFDRLPTPYGLVRCGVAPDHQNIKAVTSRYAKTAQKPGFRFFGNVTLGEHLTVDDLRAHYHQIVYATGAQTDRSLGLPGEDLEGSHSATEFVAWYNGHPDFCHLTFDLSQERVAVIGVGNVAVDVARILCRTPEELATTDIADYALEALRESKVREVVMLGRRGPAQAAFTNPEVKELGEMRDADVRVLPDEARLDPLSQKHLDANPDREDLRKVEIIQEFAAQQPSGKSRTLTIRFLVSPTAFLGDENGHVRGLRLVQNELYETEDGRLRPRATERTEDLEAGLIFRSVGYQGVALPGVPFHEKWGIIPNEEGRIVTLETGEPVRGEYVAGWIKRGPTGVIGTNKADAQETVVHMLEDLAAGRILEPTKPHPEALEQFLKTRQPHFVTFADWLYLDQAERALGKPAGRPRVKFTAIKDMLEALANKDEAVIESMTEAAKPAPAPPVRDPSKLPPGMKPPPSPKQPTSEKSRLPPGF